MSPEELNRDADAAGRPRLRAYAWLGWAVVIFGVGGFLAWATLAPLDKGVSVPGTVVSEGHRKSAQHLTGGIVDEILVKEGDVLAKGQVVARMNATQASAALNAMRESMEGLQSQSIGLQASREAKIVQLGLLKQQVQSLEELERDGFVPRNRLLDLQRQAAQLRGAIAEDQGNLGRIARQISEIRQRMVATEFEVANTSVRAPESGVVQGLSIFNAGAVIAPGHKLFDIVPQGAALVVEGQIPTHLIDRVLPGLPVELMFTSFNQATTPHIPAQVTLVSPDRFVDERTGLAYFKINAQVTQQGMDLLKGLPLRPGMPVELFVRTGERTLMNYLFRPMVDRFHGGLREE